MANFKEFTTDNMLPPLIGSNPFDLANLNDSFMGRESLGIINLSDLGRESLIGRASIGILPPINIADCGKESLGILNIDDMNCSMLTDTEAISNFLSTTSNTSNCKQSVLDTGFLMLPDRRLSLLSSVSSANSASPSFNFDNISKIYSLGSKFNEQSSDVFNFAFINSNMSNVNGSNICDAHRSRFNSVPAAIEKQLMKPAIKETSENTPILETNKSCENVQRPKSKRISFNGATSFDVDEEENSVFAEAWRSIHECHSDNDEVILDNTTPPKWEDLEDDGGDEPIAHQTDQGVTDIIFKQIDRIVPVIAPPPNTPTENFNISPLEHSDPIKVENSNSSNKSQLSRSKKSNTSIKSREAKEIIHNLSEILSNENPSDSLKAEGKHLLSNLAGMFCDNSSEDSGNLSTSIANEKINSLTDSGRKLGEANNKLNQPNKRLSQSLSGVQHVKVVTPIKGKENKRNSSKNKSSNSSNDGKKLSSINTIVGTLKPKTGEKSSVTKKGPLKATVPVTNMTKKPSFTTPTKSAPIITSMEFSKTSTPIRESKPMAQSTPTISRVPKIITSPMPKETKMIPRTFGLNSRPSSPVISCPNVKMQRRGSVSEIRRASTNVKIQRSNSVGKESGLTAALKQIRQTIASRLSENNNLIKVSDNKKGSGQSTKIKVIAK